MRRVWKYPVPLEDFFTLDLPRNARVLDVQMQKGEPHLWALVNPESATKTRHFRLAGTGHAITEYGLDYIGTIQMYDGALVLHLFECVGGK